DPFAGVQYWDRALRLAQRVGGSSALPLKKLLVAARTDRGGVGATAERIEAVVRELGCDGYFATSAKEGWQIDELREAICEAIDWQKLPKVRSTVLFRQIKQFIVNEKQRVEQLFSLIIADEKQKAGKLILSVEELYSMFLRSSGAPAETPELPIQF